MKRAILLVLLQAALLAGCSASSSESDTVASELSGSDAPASESGRDEGPESAPEQQASQSPEEALGLEEKLGRLGFQLPKEELEAIDFHLQDISGRETKLSSFFGKVVFLNFWATWCGPCRAEIPSMDRLYAELRDEGFVILAVNSQETADQVTEFARQTSMSFPVLLDSTGKVGTSYSVRALPTTYIIDPRGAIRARMVGTRDWYSPEIISLIRELGS